MRGSQPPVAHEEQRQVITMACRVLAGRGLADGILGHISVRTGENELLVRCMGPQGRGLAHTEANDIRLVDLDGNPAAEGELDSGYTAPKRAASAHRVAAAAPGYQLRGACPPSAGRGRRLGRSRHPADVSVPAHRMLEELRSDLGTILRAASENLRGRWSRDKLQQQLVTLSHVHYGRKGPRADEICTAALILKTLLVPGGSMLCR